MKLHLTIGGNAPPREGHLNVDPLAEPGGPRIFGHLGDLSGHVEDCEAAEIVALDVLDYLDPALGEATLDHWTRKLRRGGLLVVGGLDLTEVCRQLGLRKIGLAVANELIYGRASAHRRSSTSLPQRCDSLSRRGLVARGKAYRDSFYTASFVRP